MDKYPQSRKCLAVGIIILFIGISILPSSADDLRQPFFSILNKKWLYVGGNGVGNYTKIQDAVNNASKGDFVYVYNGTYYENIVIEIDGLTLIGENKYNTTICSISNAENTTKINAVQVTIQGFTITNATGSPILWDTSGVSICASNAIIQDNVICDNQLGLCTLNIVTNVTISNNIFLENGILLGNYEHNPANSDITLECFLYTIDNNTINGKPLYYFKNQHNFIVPSDAGQIILANCTNVTIKDTYLTQCNFPITLNFCRNCLVEKNIVKDSFGEIMTMRSENCIFQHNTIDEIIFGVCLDQKSNNNIIRNNIVTNSSGGVVVMIDSSNNLVYNNTFYNNTLGIGIRQGAHNNKFYNNSLEQNDIGLFLTKKPYDNSIKNNTFLNNSLLVQSIGKTQNYYNNNYWNRPKFFPKIIFGWFIKQENIAIFAIPYCITGVDWHPLKNPPNRLVV